MTDEPATTEPAAPTPTSPSTGDGLAKATARGAVWTFAVFTATKLLSFVSSVALARILAPQVFGVVSIALFILSFLDVLNEFGVGASLIHSDDDSDNAANTAFTLSLIMGIVATVLMVAVSPLVGRWFHQPSVTPVLMVLSLTFLIDSVGTVHDARLRRNLQFRKLVAPDVISSVVKLVVSVLMAWMGAGVWSVVGGNILGTLTSTVLLWTAIHWVPRLTLDREIAGRMVRYGSRIAASGVLFLLMRDVDYMIVGRSLPVSALAAYTLAFRLPDLAVTGIPFAVRKATFPFFSRLRHDPERLRTAYVKVFRVLALITTPIACGLAVTSPDLVYFLYGEQWSAAGDVMRWLALYAGIATMTGAPGPLFSAIGRPGISSLILLVRVPVTVVVLVLVVDHGIDALAIAQVCLVSTFLLVSIAVTRRVVQLPWKSVWLMLRTVLVSASGLVVLSLLASHALEDKKVSYRLIATVVAGIVGYVGSVALFERATVSEAVNLVRGKTPTLESPSDATASANNTQSM